MSLLSLDASQDDVIITCYKGGKRISYIFSIRGHKSLKPRSNFNFKKSTFLFNSKLNGRKFGFNTI